MSQWQSLGHFKSQAGSQPQTHVVGILATETALAVLPGADVLTAEERNLIFTVPDVSFTFEVDIMGRHRITVHFGGETLAVDE